MDDNGVQYSTAQYSTVQYRTVLCSVVPLFIGSAVTGKNTSGDSSKRPSACALRYLERERREGEGREEGRVKGKDD